MLFVHISLYVHVEPYGFVRGTASQVNFFPAAIVLLLSRYMLSL